MKELRLTRGYVALVDDEDFDRCSAYEWQVLVKYKSNGHISSAYAVQKRGSKMLLHRFILCVTDPSIRIDHEDRNGLNCCKSNLRIATAVQNGQNRGVNYNNRSGYKGVSWSGKWNKSRPWKAQICVDGDRISLGYFETPEAAALAYDEAAIKFFGEFACTNFQTPESVN